MINTDPTEPTTTVIEKIESSSKRWTRFKPSITSILMLIYIIVTFLLNGAVSPLTRRGFFCDDSSINYPIKPNTVGVKTLFLISLIIPSFIIKCCDTYIIKLLKLLPDQGKSNSVIYNRFYRFRRRKLSDNILEIDPEEEELISSKNSNENIKRRQLICNEDSSDCESLGITNNSNGFQLKNNDNNNNSCTDNENDNVSEIEYNNDATDNDEVNLFSIVPLDDNNEHNNNRNQLFLIGKVPNFVKRTFGECQLYLFGFASTMFFTGLGKITCGRMRPHFLQRCKPDIDCSLRENWNKYIENFNCTSTNFLPHDLSYITTSWPSGHASVMFFSMIYLIIYLNISIPIIVQFSKSERLKKRFDPLILYAIYVIMIGLAGYIALTRISDYHHHPLDVLSGSIIGAVTAIALSCSILSRKYSKLFV